MLRLRSLPNVEGEEGTLLLTADYQTAGRGQRGTGWEAAPRENLLFGFRLHPRFLRADRQFALSEALALAIVEALLPFSPDFTVKWPNDIYWRDRKVCGMLLTHTLEGSTIATTITGVGLNCNQSTFRSDAPNPVSLLQILGREVNRSAILADILHRFDDTLEKLRNSEDSEAVHARYLKVLYRRKGFHPFRDATGSFDAAIDTISPRGMLTLRLQDGSRRTYAFKEVAFVMTQTSLPR